MNIKQAKEYIKDSIKLYLKKDEEGNYRIPAIRQRPIFLFGAPGIGKTAIMEQIAQELGIALVSHSMSENIMSRVIDSVNEIMQESGIKEGILFIDELNGVSEALTPSMLRFLQYKVFGRQQLPGGWIIVTAGNSPKYSKSVQEFDVVILDRMKILEVEADYGSFKEYARERQLHAAVRNYLEIKQEDFYQAEMTGDGQQYITARGWEDLSAILTLCEEEELTVDEMLIGQYLRNPRVAREFVAYYDLYQKYKEEYQAQEILDGNVSDQEKERARNAGLDERISLMSVLIDHMQYTIRENVETYEYLTMLLSSVKTVQDQIKENDNSDDRENTALYENRDSSKIKESALEYLRGQITFRQERMKALQKAGAISGRKRRRKSRVIDFLTDQEKRLLLSGTEDGDVVLSFLKKAYDKEVASYRASVEDVHQKLENLFAFVEDVFGSGNEMLMLLTECSANQDSALFISMHGCDAYSRYNEELMISELDDSAIQMTTELEL